MSIATKMTAIADKIRAILGISSKMGLDAMSINLDTVQTNLNSAYTAVGNKDGTVPSSKTIGNLASAINSIPEGVTVQRKSGTFTTSTSGTATVNCGFKPDAVFFVGTIPMDNNSAFHAGVAFTEVGANSMETLFVPPSTSYLFTSLATTQSTSGFTIQAVRINTSIQTSNDSNHTVNYIAVKYS